MQLRFIVLILLLGFGRRASLSLLSDTRKQEEKPQAKPQRQPQQRVKQPPERAEEPTQQQLQQRPRCALETARHMSPDSWDAGSGLKAGPITLRR